MISHRYYHRKSGHVIKLFINDEAVPAIDINSIISEEAFHIRFNGHGQDKGTLNRISGLHKLVVDGVILEQKFRSGTPSERH